MGALEALQERMNAENASRAQARMAMAAQAYLQRKKLEAEREQLMAQLGFRREEMAAQQAGESERQRAQIEAQAAAQQRQLGFQGEQSAAEREQQGSQFTASLEARTKMADADRALKQAVENRQAEIEEKVRMGQLSVEQGRAANEKLLAEGQLAQQKWHQRIVEEDRANDPERIIGRQLADEMRGAPAGQPAGPAPFIAPGGAAPKPAPQFDLTTAPSVTVADNAAGPSGARPSPVASNAGPAPFIQPQGAAGGGGQAQGGMTQAMRMYLMSKGIKAPSADDEALGTEEKRLKMDELRAQAEDRARARRGELGPAEQVARKREDLKWVSDQVASGGMSQQEAQEQANYRRSNEGLAPITFGAAPPENKVLALARSAQKFGGPGASPRTLGPQMIQSWRQSFNAQSPDWANLPIIHAFTDESRIPEDVSDNRVLAELRRRPDMAKRFYESVAKTYPGLDRVTADQILGSAYGY